MNGCCIKCIEMTAVGLGQDTASHGFDARHVYFHRAHRSREGAIGPVLISDSGRGLGFCQPLKLAVTQRRDQQGHMSGSHFAITDYRRANRPSSSGTHAAAREWPQMD